jgi:hypothetical protein
MKLLNPLFDTVFKYLLEDLEVAKTIIQAITKQEVVELTPAPQESSDYDLKVKYMQIGMIRQDYVAVIKTLMPDGSEQYEKVAIEVQKSPIAPEISRFRNYLADKYRKKSAVAGEEKYLPVKTIYLIEEIFNPQLPSVLGRRGIYYDELDNQPFQGDRDQIVELFNHDSWFIQTELLPPDFKDELMYVLSIFAPWFRKSPKDRYIEIPDQELLIKKHRILERILRRLEAATQDNEVNTTLDTEIDYEKFIDGLIETSVVERRLKEEALQKTEEERRQKEEERRQKEDERRQKEDAKRKLAQKMLKYGEPVEEIIKETGLSWEEIENLR